MDTLSAFIAKSVSSKRLLHMLPKHMRRRAMSHNVKRFPRRLQARALAEVSFESRFSPRRSWNFIGKLCDCSFFVFAVFIFRACEWGRHSVRQFSRFSICEILGLTTWAPRSFKTVPSRKDILLQHALHSTQAPSKRPSRYYRRRQKKRIRKYAGRHAFGSGDGWLATHVWHAKRFRMRKIWGLCLPYRSNEKCQRIMHRASTQGVLIHVSYTSSYL